MSHFTRYFTKQKWSHIHDFFLLSHQQTKVVWGLVDFQCDWQSVRMALCIAPGQTYVPPASLALVLLTIVWLTPWFEFQLLLHSTPDRFYLIGHQDMIRRWRICISQKKKRCHAGHAAPSVLISYLGIVLLCHCIFILLGWLHYILTWLKARWL